MKYLDVNTKKLLIPSFFQVYNFGGGNGDKDREIVYSELSENTPILVNYFYLNNNFAHLFQSKLFDNIKSFKKIGDVYNSVRGALIKKGEIYNSYKSPEFDFNKKIFLLDSGSFNIIKILAKESKYSIEQFLPLLDTAVKDYYDFANDLHFDLVIQFDLGGKYTKKDNENSNNELMNFLAKISSLNLNKKILENTLKYLSCHKDFYPKMLSTIHGFKPTDFINSTQFVLKKEKEYGYRFWGFALGGIASYKQLDDSWFEDIDFSRTNKKGYIDTIGPAKACKIVHSMVSDRPIHALGCGGYNNIALNYFMGATSFDSASPERRVGDGSTESTKDVFQSQKSSESFSKYFVGGIDSNGKLYKDIPNYIDLNLVPDNISMCGCPACKAAYNMHNIKYLYSIKDQNPEAFYFARQLMGMHAVMQHTKLCLALSNYTSMESFVKEYPSLLNKNLYDLYLQIQKN